MSGFINCLFFSFFLIFFPTQSGESLINVLYNKGNPQDSVGILGDELIEAGDVVGTLKVVLFEPDAIVFQDEKSQDMVKWTIRGSADTKLLQRARHLFVAKQMKAIYEGQMRYFHKFRESYAPSLDVLVRHGFLDGGFEDGVKQDYFFEISDLGETRKSTVTFKKEPTFTATAKPIHEEEGSFYFSVDYLGDVRYSTDPLQLSWAPVWNYNEPLVGTSSRDIKVSDDE